MIITVNETYKIRRDEYNFEPIKYHKPQLIESGAYKGQMSKGGDKSTGRFFSTLENALRWIANDIAYDGGDCTISEYFERINKSNDEFKHLLELGIK